MGKKYQIMSVCSSTTRIILVGVRGCHQNGWKDADFGSQVEEFDGKR